MSAGAAPGSDLAGRAATVMGLGLFGGGVEVARYLARLGARVTVTDLRPAEQLAESLREIEGLGARLVLGEHRAEDFLTAELVVANPAVAPSHPLLAAARAAGAVVSSETALFLEACPARVALVSGTQGKSSTASATAGLLAACGFRAQAGGNIGRSLLGSLAELGPEDVVVLELSSYQLEALPRPATGLARNVVAVCVTNVLADHLERHGSVEAYEQAKRRILELAGPEATVVLSGEDPRVSRWSERGPRVVRCYATRRSSEGLNIAGGAFRLGREELGRVADLTLPGTFQRENVLAALGLARALGAAPESLAAAIGGLRGLEHRLQDLGTFAGHRVWDNGVSTTPDSTLAALRSLEGPLTLLCGGQAKRLPLDELAREASLRARRAIAFGSSAAELARAFAAAGVEARAVDTLEQAVAEAFARMQPGEQLLFSPACASFDAYRNFADRAAAFRSALRTESGQDPPDS
jgi:UDP-N-acetylmuramoylalanine--D-glutamate ligase